MKKKILAIIMAVFTTFSVVSISGCGFLDMIDSGIDNLLGTDSETSETRPPNSSTGSTSDNSSTSGDSADSVVTPEICSHDWQFVSQDGAIIRERCSVCGNERNVSNNSNYS